MGNIFTTTTEHTLWVEDAQNTPVKVRFHLVQRWGATPETIVATVRHFAFACAVMAAGMEWDQSNDKFKEMAQWRARMFQDEDDGHRGSEHDEAMVQIFTNDFPIWIPHKLMRYSLNVMTDITTALDIVRGFSDMIDASSEVTEICNRLKPATTPQKAATSPPKPRQNPGAPSELDKHFGSKNSAPVDEGGGTVELPEGVTWENDAPLIQEWNYKIEDEYNQLFTGGIVNVRVGKVARVLDTKKDGSASYEVVRMWPYYSEDRLTKYAPFALSFFVGPKEDNYDWAAFAKDWEQHFPEPGSTLEEDGIATFKVNKAKNGDKVYWNFRGLRFDEPIAAATDEELEQWATEDFYNGPDGQGHMPIDSDDVPF